MLSARANALGKTRAERFFTKAVETTLEHYLNMKSYRCGSIWRWKTQVGKPRLPSTQTTVISAREQDLCKRGNKSIKNLKSEKHTVLSRVEFVRLGSCPQRNKELKGRDTTAKRSWSCIWMHSRGRSGPESGRTGPQSVRGGSVYHVPAGRRLFDGKGAVI